MSKKQEKRQDEKPKEEKQTVMGIPIVADQSVPPGEIHARDASGATVAKAVNVGEAVGASTSVQEDAALGRKLVALLSGVAGDSGANEGAEEALARVLKERAELKVRVGTLESAAENPPAPAEGFSSERAKELVALVPLHERPLLLGDLLAQLAPHAGEVGKNESAADILRRKLCDAAMVAEDLEFCTKRVSELADALNEREEVIAKLQGAMAARRSPEASAENALREIGQLLAAPASLLELDGAFHMAKVLEQVVREWAGLRELLGAKPMVAVAVRDDSTKEVKERYALMLLEWNGKKLSPTVLEGPARPWAELVRAMRHAVETRLTPVQFR